MVLLALRASGLVTLQTLVLETWPVIILKLSILYTYFRKFLMNQTKFAPWVEPSSYLTYFH